MHRMHLRVTLDIVRSGLGKGRVQDTKPLHLRHVPQAPSECTAPALPGGLKASHDILTREGSPVRMRLDLARESIVIER